MKYETAAPRNANSDFIMLLLLCTRCLHCLSIILWKLLGKCVAIMVSMIKFRIKSKLSTKNLLEIVCNECYCVESKLNKYVFTSFWYLITQYFNLFQTIKGVRKLYLHSENNFKDHFNTTWKMYWIIKTCFSFVFSQVDGIFL